MSEGNEERMCGEDEKEEAKKEENGSGTKRDE